MRGIYLDYNGSGPTDPRVVDAMLEVFRSGIGNAASSHAFGRSQAARADEARAQVAGLVGARARDVIFTSGATEANNLTLHGLAQSARPGRSRILVSAIEHSSIREPAHWLAAQGRCKIDFIPVTSGGFVDISALEDLVGDDVLLVSVMAANSETGVLNDLAAVAELAHSFGALFHSDATQLLGRGRFDMSSMEIDLVSLSGHKFCGPPGVGALVANRTALGHLRPHTQGGGQEQALRSGSLNVPGVVGLGVAAQIANEVWAVESERVRQLRDAFVAAVVSGVSDAREHGDIARRLPNTANLWFPSTDAEALLVNIHPVAASIGSACSSGTIEPSPVLTAMGVSRDAAFESVRFSLGRFTTADEVDEAASRTIGAVQHVRSMNGDI